MLSGKFVRIVPDFDSENIQELIQGINEGHLKVSWRDGETLKTGYILVSSGIIVGALVEDVLNGGLIEGRPAFDEIIRVSEKGKIRIAEIYEGNIREIIKENPSIRVEVSSLHKTIPGRDIETLLEHITSYTGELRIYNGRESWSLYLERGKVKAARAVNKPRLRGDTAIKNLLKEMGDIIAHGKYEIGHKGTFSVEESVTQGDVFIEGLSLLSEKQKVENPKFF